MNSLASQFQNKLVVDDHHRQMEGFTLVHEYHNTHSTYLLFTNQQDYRLRTAYRGQAMTTSGQPTVMTLTKIITNPGLFRAFRPGKRKLKYVFDQYNVVVKCNH